MCQIIYEKSQKSQKYQQKNLKMNKCFRDVTTTMIKCILLF